MAEKKRPVKPGGVKAHPKLEEKKKRGREPLREKKIDRNAPCPCGSGKKYKKCCSESPSLWTRVKALFGIGKKAAADE